jgi:hypothetical protein
LWTIQSREQLKGGGTRATSLSIGVHLFESLRQSLEDLLNRATAPEDRREAIHRMRDTLVYARLAVDDLREGAAATTRKLAAEERELETMRRRLGLAREISDGETEALAAKYEQTHSERAAVLRAKLSAQEQEVALAERELAEMMGQLRNLSSGVSPANPAVSDRLGPDEALDEELNALRRASDRARHEQEAERRLDELKRRMKQ